MNEIILRIVGAIEEAVLPGPVFIKLFEDFSCDKENQFLFFVKPELVRGLSEENIKGILSMIIKAISDYGMEIQSAVVLNGACLRSYNIISSHYGVINEVTKTPSRFLAGKAEESFSALFGRSISEAHVIGGFDYMKRFGIDAEGLAELWLGHEIGKLASGMYCVHIQENDVYLVNGFYPRMLSHFTSKDSIVTGLVLSCALSWKKMRRYFLGATDPLSALPGSLRRALLERKDSFGLDTVSANFNGVHASAGPIEAVAELIRFTSDPLSELGKRKLSDFTFGRLLAARFSGDRITRLLENTSVRYDGKTVSAFDLTEELDSDEALNRLLQAEW